MKKHGLLIGIIAVIVIGAIVYFFVIKKQKDDAQKAMEMDPGALPPGTPGATDVEVEEVEVTPAIPQVEVHENLKWVKQKPVAEYLNGLLQPDQMIELRGWVDLISKQRAEDDTKWPEGNQGLYGQVSKIAHALYQMEIWNQTVLYKLKDAQG
jgi:preprotein translocase subunit YajC